MPHRHDFSPAELEVMQVLWENGALTPPELEEKFPRPIGNAAVRSTLLILLEKGHVSRTKIGRAYQYSAAVPASGAMRRMTKKLASVFCGGSPKALIAQLLEDEELSEEDIRELQDIAKKRLKSSQSTKEGQ